ncbi:MAG TPA: DNA-binding protein [Clostridiales bacterium]|nr:DNA-binding protein [Clostridiales bacterium]
MVRVEVKPELLRWARERAGQSLAGLRKRFSHLQSWERGEAMPTFKQLEAFAEATHVPIGYFFLPEPPEERVPIPDLRTMADRQIAEPSPNLLDTIYLCQQRQEWYRDFARKAGEPKRAFVGSASVTDDIEETAAEMRRPLGLDLDERRWIPTWTEALRRFIDQADALGVLVMVSGVVGTNNWRKLDPREFRGFALSDDLAPLVFINGADTRAAQMFTLAHEVAHLWLGESALSDLGPLAAPLHQVERWCNRVAAEILVPLAILREEYQRSAGLRDELDRLARRFKVSTLVVLRRIHDVRALSHQELWEAYERELERLRCVPRGSGGNFYLTQAARAGKRFARALVVSTFEGQTSFVEAFRLLGVKKVETLRRLGAELEVGV